MYASLCMSFVNSKRTATFKEMQTCPSFLKNKTEVVNNVSMYIHHYNVRLNDDANKIYRPYDDCSKINDEVTSSM